jgi:hypothetical protein
LVGAKLQNLDRQQTRLGCAVGANARRFIEGIEYIGPIDASRRRSTRAKATAETAATERPLGEGGIFGFVINVSREPVGAGVACIPITFVARDHILANDLGGGCRESTKLEPKFVPTRIIEHLAEFDRYFAATHDGG